MAFPQLFPQLFPQFSSQPVKNAQKSYEMYPLNKAHRAIQTPGPGNGKDNHGASERFLLVKASQQKTVQPSAPKYSLSKSETAGLGVGTFLVGAGLFLLGAGPVGLLMYLGIAAAVGLIAMVGLALSGTHRSA